jgi:hypothetical protein
MTISPFKTPQEMILEQAGVPHLAGGGQPPLPQQQAALAMGAQQGGLKSSLRYKPDNPITGYRAAGSGKIESQPTTFDKDKIARYINAYTDAKDQFGLPDFTPEQLVNRILVEGRSDLGYNKYDTNNKIANQIYQSMQEKGYDDAAGFPAAIYATNQRAQVHKVPFNVAWNGMGRNKETGLTGWDYHQRMNDSAYAATHPQNTPLLQYVTQLMQPEQISDADPNATNATNLLGNANMPQPTVGSAMFKKGGKVKPFHDISKVLIQKHISGK